MAASGQDAVGTVHIIVDGDRRVALHSAAGFTGRAVCHTVEGRIVEAPGLGSQGRHRHNGIACKGSGSRSIPRIGLGRRLFRSVRLSGRNTPSAVLDIQGIADTRSKRRRLSGCRSFRRLSQGGHLHRVLQDVRHHCGLRACRILGSVRHIPGPDRVRAVCVQCRYRLVCPCHEEGAAGLLLGVLSVEHNQVLASARSGLQVSGQARVLLRHEERQGTACTDLLRRHRCGSL